MAVTPLPTPRDLAVVTARVRRDAEAAGELSLGSGPWESPLDPALQSALKQILDDGTYARAAAVVASDDPSLA